jgi:hypothetical protein
MKKGYYQIKYNNKLIIARWDGLQFNHEYGTSSSNDIVPHNRLQKIRKSLGLQLQPITLSCPNGCRCFRNEDGSTTVNCSAQ